MSVSRDICNYMVSAIRRALNFDESECFPAAAPDFDSAWKPHFVVEVVPGRAQPYGGGSGAQAGGALLREQPFVLWCYYRLKLDQHSKSTMLLVEQNKGILDRFETLRALFSLTMFPLNTTPTPTDFLLIEPVEYAGESPTEWEEPTIGLVRRSITLICRYAEILPSDGALSDPNDYL